MEYFALWLPQLQEVLPQQGSRLEGKVVIDPSNPLGFDGVGQFFRTIPDDRSASIVAGLLPAGARYVKAFGTLGADSLAASANREPRPAVLFYATDDDDCRVQIEAQAGDGRMF